MTFNKSANVTAAFAFALAAFAPFAAHADDCLEEFDQEWIRHADVRAHLDEDVRRDFRVLRTATAILKRSDREEACEEMAEAIEEMLEDERRRLEDEGVILSSSEKERRARFEAARPLVEQGKTFRASGLIGVDVRNPANENLGEVDDILVNAGENNRAYLLVERGGFLGIGDDIVAVPADRVRVTEDHNTVLLDMSEEQFADAAKLEDRSLVRNAEWRRQNDAFFGPRQ